jgi:hypothetical protein
MSTIPPNDFTYCGLIDELVWQRPATSRPDRGLLLDRAPAPGDQAGAQRGAHGWARRAALAIGEAQTFAFAGSAYPIFSVWGRS